MLRKAELRPNKAQQIRGIPGAEPPVLFVDIDGVISLFGFGRPERPPGTFHSIDGIPHCIGHGCGPRLARLSERYELVWASGWEERANEYLPHILQMAGDPPWLPFHGRAVFGTPHSNPRGMA